MKFARTLAALSLSLAFASTALADDYSVPLDALTGDFSAVIGIDVDTLINRPISRNITSNLLKAEYDKLDQVIKEANYDLKKDIDTIVIAMGKNKQLSDGVMIFRLNKSSDELIKVIEGDNSFENLKHLKVAYWLNKKDNIALYTWDDNKLMLGDSKYIKAFIDRQASGKGKSLKDNKKLLKVINTTDKSKDLWFALTNDKQVSEKINKASLSSKDGKSFNAKDIQNLNGYLDMSSGIVVIADATLKNAEESQNSVYVINENIQSFTSDPAIVAGLNDIGMGFLLKAYEIKTVENQIKSKINLSHEQVSAILTFAKMADSF